MGYFFGFLEKNTILLAIFFLRVVIIIVVYAIIIIVVFKGKGVIMNVNAVRLANYGTNRNVKFTSKPNDEKQDTVTIPRAEYSYMKGYMAGLAMLAAVAGTTLQGCHRDSLEDIAPITTTTTTSTQTAIQKNLVKAASVLTPVSTKSTSISGLNLKSFSFDRYDGARYGTSNINYSLDNSSNSLQSENKATYLMTATDKDGNKSYGREIFEVKGDTIVGTMYSQAGGTSSKYNIPNSNTEWVKETTIKHVFKNNKIAIYGSDGLEGYYAPSSTSSKIDLLNPDGSSSGEYTNVKINLDK